MQHTGLKDQGSLKLCVCCAEQCRAAGVVPLARPLYEGLCKAARAGASQPVTEQPATEQSARSPDPRQYGKFIPRHLPMWEGTPALVAWLEEEAEVCLTAKVRLSGEASLYQSYINYCHSQRQPSVTLRAFVKQIAYFIPEILELPVSRSRDSHGMVYNGIRLKSQDSVL